MLSWLYVAVGGAAGAVARYGMALLVRSYTDTQWPLATFAVNALGAIGIGILAVLLERQMVHAEMRALAMVGFFGAFTTLSTVSLELLQMFERGQLALGLLYGLASLLICVVGAASGVVLTRMLL